MAKFYITTAIAYASKAPHIGNTYEAVLADAFARYRRLKGDDVYFLTGTDEHGQKIQKQAETEGIAPQALVDRVAAEVRANWDLMNVGYDQFIRTTDPAHKAAVQNIFQKLYEQGDIYKGAYEGYYCLPDEAFYTETQVGEQRVCPDCGRPVQKASEEAYFFKLGKYADRLLRHMEEHPDFILPVSRRNEMINNFLKPGLQDLCVSRTSFSWGIPVTFDGGHVIYVWIDALSNYITALGYDPNAEPTARFTKNWPADVQVIGKDISRFHTIYWPIILMALGLPLPKTICIHGWLLSGEDKMSKSAGNIRYAGEMVEQYGVDAVRYYLLREMPFGPDGTLTEGNFITRCNADLANDLGNLLSRTIAMADKYFGGALPVTHLTAGLDDEIKKQALQAVDGFVRHMDAYQTALALESVWTLVSRANKFIDETEPWKLAKNEDTHSRLAGVLYTLCEALRVLAVLLTPILPLTADRMFYALGIDGTNARSLTSASIWGSLETYSVRAVNPLFPRIEKPNAEAAPVETPKKKAVKPEAPAQSGQITIDDFKKVEIKVAHVLACVPVEGSEKLLRFTLDAGEDAPRTVVSGIAKWHEPNKLVGKNVLLVANLKPAKLRGILSQGMILSGENHEDDVQILLAPDGLKPGASVS